MVGSTLLLKGSTLSLVLRRLGLHGPDPAEDSLQLATVKQQVATAGIARLEEVAGPGDSVHVLDRLRMRSKERADAAWERLGRRGDETPQPGLLRGCASR